MIIDRLAPAEMRVAANLSELAAEAWLDTLTARPITSAADADAFEALVRIACAEDALVHTLICVRVSSTECVPMSTVSTTPSKAACTQHAACKATCKATATALCSKGARMRLQPCKCRGCFGLKPTTPCNTAKPLQHCGTVAKAAAVQVGSQALFTAVVMLSTAVAWRRMQLSMARTRRATLFLADLAPSQTPAAQPWDKPVGTLESQSA